MDRPTVGRKVWLWGVPGAYVRDSEQPFDATIIFVHSDNVVDVQYTNHGGTTGVCTSVSLRAPNVGGEGRHGVWDSHSAMVTPVATWMPYQMRASQHPALAAASPVNIAGSPFDRGNATS